MFVESCIQKLPKQKKMLKIKEQCIGKACVPGDVISEYVDVLGEQEPVRLGPGLEQNENDHIFAYKPGVLTAVTLNQKTKYFIDSSQKRVTKKIIYITF